MLSGSKHVLPASLIGAARLRLQGGAMDFDGKVVIVTGATGFLGSEVSKSFVEAAATVVGVYLLDKELPFFQRVLGPDAKRVILERADAGKEGEMEGVASKLALKFLRIDVLVNTVGGYMSGTVEGSTAADFDRAIALNLRSA